MKKSRKKRFLGILLSLALMLWLMPGMSLTALAAGTESEPISIGSWGDLNNALSGNAPEGESSANPTWYKLNGNTKADGYNSAITVAQDRYVVLDLNGKTINRNLTSETEKGYVIKVEGDLTITGDGTITGGCNNFNGGGVYVDQGGTFTMESGTISENKSRNDGGGVYVTEGSTQDGTMIYVREGDGDYLDDNAYSEAVPSFDKAGKYIVWFKVLGNSVSTL